MTAGSAPTDLPSDSRLSVFLSYAVLLAGIGAGIASAYIVITTYSPLPHWDEWALFDHLATGNASLSWLWAQHNEHRILVPKLFFLLDLYFFRGTQAFLLTSIFFIQLLQTALLSFSLWTLGGMRGSAWRTGTGLIAYCILCPTQQENLIWGFQLQFVLPAAMATLAVLTLLLYYRKPHAWLLALSIFAATIATWSLANGMLLWPLLLLAALLLQKSGLGSAGLQACVPGREPKTLSPLRSSTSTAKEELSGTSHRGPEGPHYPSQNCRAVIPAILLFAAANIALYLYHYHRPGPSAEFPGLLLAADRTLHYVAVYFGSTFVRHSSGWIPLLAGTAGLWVAVVIIIRVLPQRGTSSLLQLELSLLMLLCIATAFITASGRLHLGLEQATASRYQTFALLFWCSLGLAILFPLQQHRVPRSVIPSLPERSEGKSRDLLFSNSFGPGRGSSHNDQQPGFLKLNVFSAFLLLLMVGFATQVRLPLIDAQWRQLRLKRISLSLLTGVHDPAALADAYPDPQAVLRAAQYMKDNRLSIFAGDLYAQLGQPFDATYHVRPATDCSGYVSSTQLLPADDGPGLRITGFAWDKQSNRPARDIVAVANDRISGYGTSVSIPQDLSAARPNSDPGRFGWVAYVRDIPHPGSIQLYAVVGRDSADACLIAEARP